MKLEQLIEAKDNLHIRIFLVGYPFPLDTWIHCMFAFFENNQRISDYLVFPGVEYKLHTQEPFQPVAILPVSEAERLSRDQLVQIISHLIRKSFNKSSIQVVHSSNRSLVGTLTIGPNMPEWESLLTKLHPSSNSDFLTGISNAVQRAIEERNETRTTI